MTIATAENYAGIVSQRVAAERLTLARRWLNRLNELLTVEANEVFPSKQLLNHIPALIEQIAAYLSAPADEEISANTTVIEKARELGQLRHRQQASVHQLLREYEILGEILEDFVVEETQRLGLRPSSQQCFEILRRLTRSARTLTRTTIDTFVSEYTSTIHERDDRIKAFNRMASHELRSPIGTLLFAAAALKMEPIRANAERFDRVADTVRQNAERLSWLVQNLQRLAQLSEPVATPSEQRVELTTIASEVKRQLEDMAERRRVEVRADPDLPALVLDPARLELVLLNLVSNAIKYSDPDKPHSFVEIALTNRDDGACAICVRDNGLGIPEDDQPLVFERFFRAHAHRDQELGVSGSGLGLAIVADCVRELGGSIRFESQVGRGTAFFITLPTGAENADRAENAG
jgi:signal transduction histidine kinase